MIFFISIWLSICTILFNLNWLGWQIWLCKHWILLLIFLLTNIIWLGMTVLFMRVCVCVSVFFFWQADSYPLCHLCKWDRCLCLIISPCLGATWRLRGLLFQQYSDGISTLIQHFTAGWHFVFLSLIIFC